MKNYENLYILMMIKYHKIYNFYKKYENNKR